MAAWSLVPMPMVQVTDRYVDCDAVTGAQFAGAPQFASTDQITLLEEEKVQAYFGAGYLWATPERSEPQVVTTEYENEPIKGLPGFLPKDESILWQGSPDWQIDGARRVSHATGHRLVRDCRDGCALLPAAPGRWAPLSRWASPRSGSAFSRFLAWAQARSTVYTLTQKRLVMRFGVALPKCVNLPLAQIVSADVKPASAGHCDVALRVAGRFPLGWLQMWPHVRPWKINDPQPMLRAIPESAIPLLSEDAGQG